MLTVGTLLEDLGLEAAAGVDAAGRPIRWVHISELEDPTPWLSGGELMLTTGINLGDQGRRRRFVELLCRSEAAGLGFGTGFDHPQMPTDLVEEAGRCGLPLFEVPYETPFIAITEHAFKALVNEQYRVLERGLETQTRLESLVLAGRGLPDLLAAIAGAVEGAAMLIDDQGRELARHPSERGMQAEAVAAIGSEIAARAAGARRAAFKPESGPSPGGAVCAPIPHEGGEARGSWLVVARPGHQAGELEWLVARQAATVVGLELMRERVVRHTERRLAGDVVAEAVGGNLGAEELRARLAPFGVVGPLAILLFDLDPDPADSELVADRLEADGIPGLVAVNSSAGRPLLCAIVQPGERRPADIARDLRELLGGGGRVVHASVSRPTAVDALRRGFHEARCALEATALANGSRPEVASHEDLGAYTLLLSITDDDALRAYSDSLLAPLEDGEGDYGPELLRSLEAFIERNGQWERAARDLFCHRHTLRYRIRKIEELTGRDLGQAQDRIELWLALRARELIR